MNIASIGNNTFRRSQNSLFVQSLSRAESNKPPNYKKMVEQAMRDDAFISNAQRILQETSKVYGYFLAGEKVLAKPVTQKDFIPTLRYKIYALKSGYLVQLEYDAATGGINFTTFFDAAGKKMPDSSKLSASQKAAFEQIKNGKSEAKPVFQGETKGSLVEPSGPGYWYLNVINDEKVKAFERQIRELAASDTTDSENPTVTYTVYDRDGEYFLGAKATYSNNHVQQLRQIVDNKDGTVSLGDDIASKMTVDEKSGEVTIDTGKPRMLSNVIEFDMAAGTNSGIKKVVQPIKAVITRTVKLTSEETRPE